MARRCPDLEILRGHPPDPRQLLSERPSAPHRRPLARRPHRRDDALLERGRRPFVADIVPNTWKPQPLDGVADGLILFDGVCVLCSWWVHFVIERDRAAAFRFAPVQGRYGAALAARLGISVANPETNAVVTGGRAYFKSDAAIAVISRLPG